MSHNFVTNWLLGVCDIEKKLYLDIFLITIIRQYFAVCDIVPISDCGGQLQFFIFFTFCVVSSHQ